MEYTILRLGQQIKRLRRSKGLTADALARQVGVTENAIRKLEAGDSKEPRFSTGIRLAAALSTSPEVLLGSTGRHGRHTFRVDLGSAIQKIRALRVALNTAGVAHASIFGSVARGDAHSTSDVDIVIEPAHPDRFTLFNLGEVSDILEQALETKVDVLTAETLRQSRFAQAAAEEAILAF